MVEYLWYILVIFGIFVFANDQILKKTKNETNIKNTKREVREQNKTQNG